MALGLTFAFDTSKGETPESVARKRALANAILGNLGNRSARNVGEGVGNALNSIGEGIQTRYLNNQADEAAAKGQESANSAFDNIRNMITGVGSFPPAPGASANAGPAPTDYPSQRVAQAFGDPQASNMNGNQVFSSFMDTVKQGGLTNPYGLAAVAGTGKRESGFSPENAARTWSDPSERGAAGTAGGILSWRGPRYNALAATGDLSPSGQARYFLSENPQLIASLNSAKSVEEAIGLMNNAWKFAGYNRSGGETAARLQAAQAFLPQFQGANSSASDAVNAMATGQPIAANMPGVQVASLDPSAAMPDTMQEPPLPQQQPMPVSPSVSGKGDRLVKSQPVPMQPGPLTSGPTQSGFIDRMTSPLPMTGGAAMPMQENKPLNEVPAMLPGSQVAQASQPAPQPAPDLSRIPVTAGGNAGAIQPGQQQIPMDALLKAANNPWLTDTQRSVINMMIKQQMEQNDPNNALDTELKRAQIDAYKRKGGSLINAGNGNIYDPQSGSWISAPATQESDALFDGKSVQAQGLNYLIRSGGLTKEQAAQLAAGKTITDPATGAITFMTPQGLVTQPGGEGQGGAPNGGITLTGPKKPTDTEYVTGLYADRMATSGKTIDSLESTGKDYQQNVLSGLPFGNYMVSNDFQKFDQAQRDFINAVLRRESGAVISNEEFDNARRQYLPQPGDSDEVLKQKRRNREIAIQGMQRASGPSYTAPKVEQPRNDGWQDGGNGVKIRVRPQ